MFQIRFLSFNTDNDNNNNYPSSSSSLPSTYNDYLLFHYSNDDGQSTIQLTFLHFIILRSISKTGYHNDLHITTLHFEIFNEP
ncbi:hypothetical protein DERP_006268 [Dermatophagoides pteronyssinus]|uniref:Uncharacterized protein n=1 Tax=Dermatophagoides pteronyssinus TaxID=6956 RepID=A0ABQ8IXY7_DERPT|nr:hypothetical protein DERP_006268 [Dermatophagoides pteronyssinus]